MRDVLLGLLAIAIGPLFCFRGYLTMRLVIPLWGAFAGFLFGAGLVDHVTGDGFLVGALAWLVGLAVAVLFGLLAYLQLRIVTNVRRTVRVQWAADGGRQLHAR